MIDLKKRIAAMKFVGEVLTKPESFAQHVHFTVKQDGEAIVGTYRATGPIAEFIKGVSSVEGTVESRIESKK